MPTPQLRPPKWFAKAQSGVSTFSVARVFVIAGR